MKVKTIYSGSALSRVGQVITGLMLVLPLTAQTNVVPPSNDRFTVIEVSPFAGFQWFISHPVQRNLAGPIGGVRVTEDFTDYWGLEESVTVGYNDVRLKLFPGTPRQTLDFESSNFTFAINPVLNFRPRGAKLRPFLTIGPGYTRYIPKEQGLSKAGYFGPGARELEERYGPSVNFGGGIKFNANQHLGFRLDVRGQWSQTSHYGIPSTPSGPGTIYSPHEGSEESLQATLGVSFRFGYREPAPYVPPAPPPVAPPTVPPALQVSISGAMPVCPGSSVKLTANVTPSNFPTPPTYTYAWTADNASVGGNSDSVDITSDTIGSKSVAVTVTAGSTSKTSDPVTVQFRENAPTVSGFSASPNTLQKGQTATLSATPNWDCNDQAQIAYSVQGSGNGTVSGTTYDSSTVAFDANATGEQRKTVTLVATARNKGGEGTATTTVTVIQKPQAEHYEVDFPKGSSRVNNCGKRVLLQTVTQKLQADPQGTVIVIGHIDDSEKRMRNLDRQRALNTAAILSAGKGICPALDLGRVKLAWVGTDQKSEPKPSMCEVSVKERRNQYVPGTDDRAKYRRVEIWFVPSGADMPAGIGPLQDVPARAIKALGCPR